MVVEDLKARLVKVGELKWGGMIETDMGWSLILGEVEQYQSMGWPRVSQAMQYEQVAVMEGFHQKRPMSEEVPRYVQSTHRVSMLHWVVLVQSLADSEPSVSIQRGVDA